MEIRSKKISKKKLSAWNHHYQTSILGLKAVIEMEINQL